MVISFSFTLVTRTAAPYDTILGPRATPATKTEVLLWRAFQADEEQGCFLSERRMIESGQFGRTVIETDCFLRITEHVREARFLVCLPHLRIVWEYALEFHLDTSGLQIVYVVQPRDAPRCTASRSAAPKAAPGQTALPLDADEEDPQPELKTDPTVDAPPYASANAPARACPARCKKCSACHIPA